MKTRTLTITAAFVAILALGWALLRGGAREAAAVAPESAVAERRVFATTVAAIGTVKPQIGAEVKVGSRISGRVRRLAANIGGVVRRGQVIAELETEELDALVAERRAALAVEDAALASARATTEFAAAELARQLQLESQGMATRADADVARERHGVAVAQRQRAEADLARARAALDQALVQRSFATLHAPIGGVVASVATQEGETIAAGLNAPTFLTIVDLGRLQVDTYVDEVDIGRVEVGQRATFTVDAFPSRDFSGVVGAIYPTATIQDNVVKYIVAVRIDSTGGMLRPEMTATVRIALAPREVLAVPVRAVRRVEGRNVVYVGESGPGTERVVRTGWRDGPWVQITEGLAPGERVLLDPPAPGESP